MLAEVFSVPGHQFTVFRVGDGTISWSGADAHWKPMKAEGAHLSCEELHPLAMGVMVIEATKGM